jgi:hypothetical protein
MKVARVPAASATLYRPFAATASTSTPAARSLAARPSRCSGVAMTMAASPAARPARMYPLSESSRKVCES